MMKADAQVSLRFLVGGATILVLGIALSATGEVMVGSLCCIVGVALLISGLHTFGRAGPDTGTDVTPAASPSPPSPPPPP